MLSMNGPFTQADWFPLPRLTWDRSHITLRWLTIYWSLWF